MKIPSGRAPASAGGIAGRHGLAPSGTTGERRSPAARIRAFFRSGSEGGALVELAVTLPLFLIIMTGIFSFSIAYYQKLLLAEAVANGGRALAVSRGYADPCASTAAAIYGAAPTLNPANMTLTFTLNSVSYGTGVTTCPGANSGPNANMVEKMPAQITATYKCNLSVYGMKFANCSLGTTITEVIQ
jgi:Flp pilus assembly protein TadG